MAIIHQLLSMSGDSSLIHRCTDERVWSSIEFIITLVQIVAAIVVLTRARGEHSETTWIICYACGCIATLPILSWRFWYYHNYDFSQRRINRVVDILSMMLEYLFVGWFVLFVWVFLIGNSPSSLDRTTQLFWLSMAFLAFCSIRYVLPNVISAAMCFCLLVSLCINAIWDVIELIVTLIREQLAHMTL